jgi:cysteine desulfurase
VRKGAEVVEVGLDSSGVVDLERLASVLDRSVGLVAMFEGQNEIGSRNPVPVIVELVRRLAPRALVHLDSVQSFGKPAPPPFEAGIDSASISGHKVHGPKGIGALLLRTRTPLTPQLVGGGQEGDRRSGTENVPGIVGLGAAVEILARALPSDHAAMRTRRDRLERELVARIPGARVLATGPSSLPHVVTLVIPSAPGEVVLHHLERQGIAASAGAACHSAGAKLSPALLARGLREEEVRCTVRLSLSRETTDEEIEAATTALPRIAESVRVLGAAR